MGFGIKVAYGLLYRGRKQYPNSHVWLADAYVPKKNILKSNDFGVMQTVFFAFTCKFGLVL